MRRPFVHLALLAALGVGCEDKTAPKITPVASASSDVPQGPVLDGKLGEEVAGIAKGAKNPPPKSSSAAEGPPPSGMFDAGAGEKAHPKGAPPKVELLGDGNEPRIQLGATRPEGKQETVVVVAIASGQQQALPPIAVRLVIHEEGKDGDKKAKKKDAAAAAAPAASSAAPDAAPAPAAALRVVADLVDATVAAGPGANVPKQVADAFGKLKGSTFSWTVGPEGPGPVDHKLVKDGEEGLDIALEAIEEALSQVLVSVPTKPVGEGGHWMVTDRSTSMGIDAVRYRHITVSKIDGDRATLSMEIRKYGTNDRLDLPLGPQMSSASLDKLEATGKATLVLLPKAYVADTAEVSSRLFANLVPPGGRNAGAQPQQRMQVQLEVMGQVRSPEALAAAAKEGAAAPQKKVPGGAPPGAPPGHGPDDGHGH
jgi:hypothetical protein